MTTGRLQQMRQAGALHEVGLDAGRLASGQRLRLVPEVLIDLAVGSESLELAGPSCPRTPAARRRARATASTSTFTCCAARGGRHRHHHRGSWLPSMRRDVATPGSVGCTFCWPPSPRHKRPVIGAQRLRNGWCGSPRGAAHLVVTPWPPSSYFLAHRRPHQDTVADGFGMFYGHALSRT
jgi:hypothetical protein